MVKRAANFYGGLDGVITNAAATQESFVNYKKDNFLHLKNTRLSFGKKYKDKSYCWIFDS